ncbi:serine/threonine-protein kinase RsbW [Roseomonas rosea]|uniref:Serine/threonine-protein kinase RsbW n=1 Tax=Muricoccus roseus TaxID=198092 RepID=A0A1M6M244_9PROT|nr:ATP-binding protein [Roseomonas rosea]SHJ77531.1 serine/threonine-protein kinase RsbW [Roseomonas rosea]
MDAAALRHEMPPEVDALPALLDRLEEFAEGAGLSPRAAQHLALVTEELAANVAMHAAGATLVTVEASRQGDSVHLLIEDDGPPFDPLSVAEPDLDAGVETRDVGGLGVHFVRRMTREAHYERRDGRNRLTALLDAG